MKKIIVIMAVMVFIATASFAQIKYAGGLTFGSDMSVKGGMGVGLNFRGIYDHNDQLSFVPGFTFVLPSSEKTTVFGNTYKTSFKAWQLNADAQYKFHEIDGFTFYGVGGLNFTHINVEIDNELMGGSASDNKLGVDIGAGALYNRFYGELKYDTAFEQIALSIGIFF